MAQRKTTRKRSPAARKPSTPAVERPAVEVVTQPASMAEAPAQPVPDSDAPNLRAEIERLQAQGSLTEDEREYARLQKIAAAAAAEEKVYLIHDEIPLLVNGPDGSQETAPAGKPVRVRVSLVPSLLALGFRRVK